MKLLLLLLIYALPLFATHTGELTVILHRIQPQRGGELRIFLADKESWSDTTRITPQNRYIVPVNDTTMAFTFTNLLLPSTVAIKAAHDENCNGKIDFKIFPIPFPTEGFAISNEYIPKGIPKFKHASFTLTQSDTLHLNVIYGRKDKKNIRYIPSN